LLQLIATISTVTAFQLVCLGELDTCESCQIRLVNARDTACFCQHPGASCLLGSSRTTNPQRIAFRTMDAVSWTPSLLMILARWVAAVLIEIPSLKAI